MYKYSYICMYVLIIGVSPKFFLKTLQFFNDRYDDVKKAYPGENVL